MKKFLAFVYAFLFCITTAHAQYNPPPVTGGNITGTVGVTHGGTGATSLTGNGAVIMNSGGTAQTTVAPSTSGNVLTSNGTAWTSAAASGGGGGGGSSPFAPSGFVSLTNYNGWNSSLAVSPNSAYVFVGVDLASNGHGTISKVKVSDGTVTACDLGAGVSAGSIAVSPDGSYVYAIDVNARATWWKVQTSNMSLIHTSTLAVGLDSAGQQQFDLSPDGTIYAYVSDTDAKLYMINTSTYAVTNQTMSHTAGNLSSVCFYNGSNSNVYVAHAGSADVDLYAIGGAYTSSVSTGAGGTPNFWAMRSGVNGNFFIADSGTNKALITVHSGTAAIQLVDQSIASLSTANISAEVAVCEGVDCVLACTVLNEYLVIQNGATNTFQNIGMPSSLGAVVNLQAAVLAPDDSGNTFVLAGCDIPVVWSVPTILAQTPPGTIGNAQISDGKGNWVSAGLGTSSASAVVGGAFGGSTAYTGNATYNLTAASPSVLVCDSTAGNITFNLPAVASAPIGKQFNVAHTVRGGNIVLTPSGAEKINGYAGPGALQYYISSATVTNSGTEWVLDTPGASNDVAGVPNVGRNGGAYTIVAASTKGNGLTSDGSLWVSQAPYFTSSDQTITAAGALTIAHGLGYVPGEVWSQLVCQADEAGYTAGQVVSVGGSQTVSVIAVQNDGFSSIVDSTNLTIRYGSDASTFTIPHATTGAATAITNSKWKCRFFAR